MRKKETILLKPITVCNRNIYFIVKLEVNMITEQIFFSNFSPVALLIIEKNNNELYYKNISLNLYEFNKIKKMDVNKISSIDNFLVIK